MVALYRTSAKKTPRAMRYVAIRLRCTADRWFIRWGSRKRLRLEGYTERQSCFPGRPESRFSERELADLTREADFLRPMHLTDGCTSATAAAGVLVAGYED